MEESLETLRRENKGLHDIVSRIEAREHTSSAEGKLVP